MILFALKSMADFIKENPEDIFVAYVVISVLLYVTSIIACPLIMRYKGRSAIGGLFMGLFLGEIGLLISILIRHNA